MRVGLLAGIAAVAVVAAGSAEAANTAKYYGSCATPVTEARALVPPPPADVAGTAKKVGAAADVAGKLGGAFGFGGLGGLGKVASTTQQVTKYANLVGDATQFASKMKQDYPDAATRIAAYGDKMAADADKVAQAEAKVDTAHECYEKAFAELQAGVTSKEIKGKDIKERQKEIQDGIGDASSILSDARTNMDANMRSYNDAINGDTAGMNLNLGSLVSAAGAVGVTPTAAMGLPKVPGVADTPEAQMQAYQVAAAAQKNGYSAGNTQSQNYAALARTQGQIYAGQVPPVPSAGGANLGTLGSLSQIGVLGAGPMGPANLAAAAASAAKGAAQAPQPNAVVAQVSEVQPDMMKSLQKAGLDSATYMAVYNELGAKSDKLGALKATAGAKLD